MIVVLKTSSTDEELEKIVEAVKGYGYHPEVVKGKSKILTILFISWYQDKNLV